MSKVFIIAEAGVNHNGDLNIAKRMIDVAAEAGVGAIKFQTFKTEKLVCKDAPKAEYQTHNTQNAESQYDMLKKLELSKEMHQELFNYCKQQEILFLSTAFDMDSIELLSSLGIDIYKIPSGEITNYPYLRKVGSLHARIIMSTGMSTIQEIHEALNLLYTVGSNDITLLHCNTGYPTNMNDVNLNAMKEMQKEFQIPIGYSDHTLGIEVPIAAVALGAQVIEKHFTLDRTMNGPDHKASLEPNELKEMVRAIRNIEMALGDGIKKPTASEQRNIVAVRKSIVAARDIKRGEIFSEENITIKRPGTGVSPMKWKTIIGTCAHRDYRMDEMIEK